MGGEGRFDISPPFSICIMSWLRIRTQSVCRGRSTPLHSCLKEWEFVKTPVRQLG